MSSTGRYSEWATIGCSVAKAMPTRVGPTTDSPTRQTPRMSAVLTGPHQGSGIALDQVPIVRPRHGKDGDVWFIARGPGGMNAGRGGRFVPGVGFANDLGIGACVVRELVDVAADPTEHRRRRRRGGHRRV